VLGHPLQSSVWGEFFSARDRNGVVSKSGHDSFYTSLKVLHTAPPPLPWLIASIFLHALSIRTTSSLPNVSFPSSSYSFTITTTTFTATATTNAPSYKQVAAGSTKAAITAHLARQGNTADVQAKEGAQETLVTLGGMLIGVREKKGSLLLYPYSNK